MTDIFDTIKDIALNTAKKADMGYKASMLKLSVAALNKMLESQYRELGTAVYKMCRNEETASKEASEKIAALTVQIDGTRKRIAVLERRIEYILGLVRCPDCGNTVKMKNAYCSACGRKLAAEEEDVFENENQMSIPKEDV
ncbi:MAG: hydrogenase maturation nickel metallochaperone HypA [Ruminococcaceae bacterium]|nr:hydrogenase maturation nickel metallochaperone HypA [Oscillospiraceae bacterium]